MLQQSGWFRAELHWPGRVSCFVWSIDLHLFLVTSRQCHVKNSREDVSPHYRALSAPFTTRLLAYLASVSLTAYVDGAARYRRLDTILISYDSVPSLVSYSTRLGTLIDTHGTFHGKVLHIHCHIAADIGSDGGLGLTLTRHVELHPPPVSEQDAIRPDRPLSQ